ncbi:MAG TPA: Fic family protein [Candidatus Saccharimonadales bacterium]|nr:Fic family protein [Candidatus Saccharimonadales bacterium]
MTIPIPFTITNTMLSLLTKIEVNKVSFQSIEIPSKIINNLKRQSLLKSSVFSAKIEGNTLSMMDVEKEGADEEKMYERQEIENILNALSYLQDKGLPNIIEEAFLLKLHSFVLHKLVHKSKSGVLRKEPSAIFNQDGIVVYMPPPPSEIPGLISSLLHFINNKNDLMTPIHALLTHITFEKIHPFLDGNGRVGRLLTQTLLAKDNYHFNWLISFEELLNERKSTYYTLLDQNDATEFIEFMLEILLEESENLKRRINLYTNPAEEDYLLPRRREILDIIKDQTIVSLNQIQRRFLKVPARTLRYDLSQLEKQGFIRKIGTTRGAMYTVKKKRSI